jgi:putative MATE family efflux protein
LVTGLISAVTTVLVLLFGEYLFDLLFGKVEPDVLDAGLTYLRISAYSFLVLAIYNGCAGLFRSMGKTRSLLYVSILMNAINVVGNAIGIFALHAGVAGVAYPSLISRMVAAAVMLALSLDQRNPICIRAKLIFSWRPQMIRRIFRIAIPNSIENGLFQISKVALSSIVAGFGTVQIAANGVAQSFWSMAALFCLAMGPAFITVIGQYMGAGDTEGAEYYMKKLLRLTYLGGTVWNVLFFLAVPLILKMSDLSPEAVHLVMILAALHNIFNAMFCPVSYSMASGMRAAGDVKFTMYASIFSTVICRVILSILFGEVMGMGVIGITWAMIADWAIHAALIALRYRSGKWKIFQVI